MAHLRALFVLFHLLAITLLALPAPVGGMNRHTFASEGLQANLAGWRAVLGGLGWEVSAAEIEDRAWRAGKAILAARRVVLAPFRPYAELTGASQGWRMFAYNNRSPAWMRVEVEEAGSWTILWEARSERATWRRRQFDEGHFRGVMNDWSWLRDRKSYERFARWLAGEVRQERPAATRLRVRMVQRRTPRPAVLAAEGFPPTEDRWLSTLELAAPEAR
jgi:hypothetical protein